MQGYKTCAKKWLKRQSRPVALNRLSRKPTARWMRSRCWTKCTRRKHRHSSSTCRLSIRKTRVSRISSQFWRLTQPKYKTWRPKSIKWHNFMKRRKTWTDNCWVQAQSPLRVVTGKMRRTRPQMMRVMMNSRFRTSKMGTRSMWLPRLLWQRRNLLQRQSRSSERSMKVSKNWTWHFKRRSDHSNLRWARRRRWLMVISSRRKRCNRPSETTF